MSSFSFASEAQRAMYVQYMRQLYRMTLRASRDASLLPTEAARTHLRSHARAQFRKHAPLVRTDAEAQELLQRAHTVLLAIADEAGKARQLR
jgi:hypothetical protein